MTALNSELRISKTIKLFINGEFPRTESGRSFPVYHSGNQKLYAHMCLASRKDLRNAVEAAKSAQKGWAGKSAYNRSQILYRMAEMADAKRAEFVEVITGTTNFNTDQATAMINAAVDAFVYYAGFADKYQQVTGAVNPVTGPHHNFTSPEPMGTIAYITSEVFNLGQWVADICAIILSGNTVVVLMQKEGAATLAALAEVFATSDLPKGVVNLLSGDLDELIHHFASHMEIQAIAYAGMDIAKAATLKTLAVENLKRVVIDRSSDLNLKKILNFVEYKTAWHPVGE